MTKVSQNEPQTFLQLFGSDPKDLGNATKMIEGNSNYGVDINMGCPVKKVIKTGAGSALLKSPEIVGKVVQQMRRDTSKPLSVKIRKGFSENNAELIGKIVQDSGADILVIHPRLQTEMFSGESDFKLSIELAKKLDIKVIHSGDINSLEDAKKFRDSELFGIMLGRAVMGAPWLFREINENRLIGFDEKREIIETHFRKIIASDIPIFKKNIKIKKCASWYSKGISESTHFRKNIMSLDVSQNELIDSINNFFTIEV